MYCFFVGISYVVLINLSIFKPGIQENEK